LLFPKATECFDEPLVSSLGSIVWFSNLGFATVTLRYEETAIGKKLVPLVESVLDWWCTSGGHVGVHDCIMHRAGRIAKKPNQRAAVDWATQRSADEVSNGWRDIGNVY
jgi:hypothetical protein